MTRPRLPSSDASQETVEALAAHALYQAIRAALEEDPGLMLALVRSTGHNDLLLEFQVLDFWGLRWDAEATWGALVRAEADAS